MHPCLSSFICVHLCSFLPIATAQWRENGKANPRGEVVIQTQMKEDAGSMTVPWRMTGALAAGAPSRAGRRLALRGNTLENQSFRASS
jgi:hypothetical protein